MTKQCPNCGHFKVEPRWGRAVLCGSWLCIAGIPLILFFGLGLFVIAVGLTMAIISPIALRGKLVCTNCYWRV